ncbi:MAG: DNA repair photolyase [Spirochaetales bacterium]|uniref:DNA repair photolyase n=1 Tax=Candidatus Thalassospirochaeta sargassi TaxID=3119039 RepID=A0AAJ1MNP3_9SPIO|nr:DNA repair photolyase [Spirochaetales bacterium]
MSENAFLSQSDINFIEKKSTEYRLSFQDRRTLEVIASDLRRWDEGTIEDLWEDPDTAKLHGKDLKKKAVNTLKSKWEKLKTEPKDYTAFKPDYNPLPAGDRLSEQPAETPIMGRCPVASEKTRCCNLQTLDAVINCGFDCSYCSIQTFYHTDSILFHDNLKQKLSDIAAELDPGKRYHIGTGQSSDSLMWGNRRGMMDDLFDFARSNPNVLLELKSKSANIAHLLENDIPANVLTTWTLNPDTIVENEEHLTARLDERIEAAAKTAAHGGLIGFHFHPIIIYKGWQEEYEKIFSRLLQEFNSEDITHISFGTLTFIKPVIKELRKRNLKSKILQMPMEEIAGKLSYPFETKKEIFSFAYNSLRPWHADVFFYLCMEDIRLWKPVFGREYDCNEDFEQDMIESYFKKVEKRWTGQSL